MIPEHFEKNIWRKHRVYQYNAVVRSQYTIIILLQHDKKFFHNKEDAVFLRGLDKST